MEWVEAMNLMAKRQNVIHVTFDSNVWRSILSPDRFPKEKCMDSFRKIRHAIIERKVCGCLFETMLTL